MTPNLISLNLVCLSLRIQEFNFMDPWLPTRDSDLADYFKMFPCSIAQFDKINNIEILLSEVLLIRWIRKKWDLPGNMLLIRIPGSNKGKIRCDT